MFNKWNNQTIVFLYVNDEKSLYKCKDKIIYSDKTISTFNEPDISNQLTAICCYDTGEIFKTLKLA